MSAQPLAALQQRFLAHLRGQCDDGLADAMAGGRMPGGVGLRIYTHAYRARLRAALENDHAVLGAYLGDALWAQLCEGYIQACPSRHRSLRDFGAGLPEYLAQADAFSAHPQIAEIAAFERALLDSFDAADDERATWDQILALPELDWPGMRLRFHPSLKLHRVAHNSVEIWRAVKDRQMPPPTSAAPGRAWALWRDGERVSRFRSLDGKESALLAHSLRGGNFAGLCEQLTAWRAPQEVPMTALGYLRDWSAAGWIARWS